MVVVIITAVGRIGTTTVITAVALIGQ